MSDHERDELIEILRAANPVRDADVPAASLARIRARGREIMAATDAITTQVTRQSRGRRRPVAIGLSVVATGALALALLAGHLPAGTSAGPDVAAVDGGAAGGAAGAAAGGLVGDGTALECADSYSIGALGSRTFAFDGTVTAMSDDRVTFAVNEAFRGVSGPSVTLGTPAVADGAVTLAGGQVIVPGGRYLVSGDGTWVWACGFTQPFDPKVAEAWRAALAH